jgi:DNA repair exonuclease SbcCD nuclease subunit
MKILWFTDVHCSNNASNIDNIHLNETIALFAQIRQYVLDNVVDAIVFGGDMFNDSTKIGTKVLTVLSEMISSLAICAPVFILTGNHDTIEDAVKETIEVEDNGYFKFARSNLLSPFFKYENVTGIDKPVAIKQNDGTILYFIPYISVPTSHIKNLLVKNKKNNNKILFGHFDLEDMNYSKIANLTDTVSSKFLNENFDLSFIGHIHEPMEFGNTIVTGSSRNMDFRSLSKNKYFYIIDTIEKTYEKIINENTCIYQICTGANELLEFIQNNTADDLSKTKILYRYKELKEIKEVLTLKKYFKSINFEKPVSDQNKKTLIDVKNSINREKYELINKDNIQKYMLEFIDDKNEHDEFLSVFKMIMEAEDENQKNKK